MRIIGAFILREMSTSYGRHPGGFVWAILEPVAAITLLTVVFSMAFRAPALGDNFALFYATGYLPFMIYTDTSTKISQTLKFSKQLLTYPKVSYIDAILARFILNLFVQVIVFTIIILVILAFEDSGNFINFIDVLSSLLLAAFLGFGIGVFNCYFFTKYIIWERVWFILSRPTFLLSGIFFIYESVPMPFRDYLWYNPLLHIVGKMRKGFYPTYSGLYLSELYVLGIIFISSVIGLFFLTLTHRTLIQDL
jgi:capsular polysaccharide transport system permease protein